MAIDHKRYCGIVFIGGGSSWAWAATQEKAAKDAARTAKEDWKSLFKFEKGQQLGVLVFDMQKHDGWYADHSGVFDPKTKEKLTPCLITAIPI